MGTITKKKTLLFVVFAVGQPTAARKVECFAFVTLRRDHHTVQQPTGTPAFVVVSNAQFGWLANVVARQFELIDGGTIERVSSTVGQRHFIRFTSSTI